MGNFPSSTKTERRREPRHMEVNVTTVFTPAGASASPDGQQATGSHEDTAAQHPASELASLDIDELVRLMEKPERRTLQVEPNSATDDRHVKIELETLKAELNTSASTGEKAKQFDLYCQIGDLYRTKLHDLQSALQYYQNMLECSKSLTGDKKEAKSHNRLGLTYDILGMEEEAIRSHKGALEICKVTANNESDICVANKNLASSLALFDQVPGAKTNYESALAVAKETGNKPEQLDIYLKLGDLHIDKLEEPQVSHKYHTEMLALAMELGKRHMEGEAYLRLGIACSALDDDETALDWHLKDLTVKQEEGGKKEEITAHINVGDAYMYLEKTDQATSHLNTALQMAEETGDQQQQMQIHICLGEMHRNQLDSPRTAIQYYEQYLALARQLGDRGAEGTAYNKLGLAHHGIGDHQAALEWYQQVLKMREEDGDKKAQISQHINVGYAYLSMEETDQATSHFDTALHMAQQIEDPHGQMQACFCLGDVHMEQLHSPRTAIPYHELYLALTIQLGEKSEEGLAYNRLGQAYYEMSEFGEALGWYQKQLKMGQENGDDAEQINAQSNVGNAYMSLGKTDEATSHFNTALQMAQQTGDQHGQMRVSFYMGEMQRNQLHSPRTSIQYYEQHLALAKQLGDRRQEGAVYNKLGLAHHDIGEHEAAMELYKKALKIQEEDGDKKSQIILHTNMGDTYRLLGKVDQATSHLNTALQMAQQTGDLHEQLDVYFCLGEMQREQLHSPSASIQHYEQYLALARELGDRRQEGLAYNKLGQAHYEMGEFQEALDWFQKDLKMSQEIGDKEEQIKAHKNLAASFQALGNLDLTTSHYQSAITIAMETGNKQDLADTYLKLGDSHRAHEPQLSHTYYTEMLALTRDLKRKDAERQAYNKLGLTCNEMKDHEAALEWHQKNLTMSEEKEDKMTAHTNVGHSYQALGKADLARSHYQSAMTIAMETGNKQEQKYIAEWLASL
ncbi:tetratricopeptide repeat protein 28-like isoform X1 [Branchiostoma lanceolatum]|uniref:tetratricopeptide repeat protein 28-like isoform X1 n=2 Tax=Branchiostoma lanceolatum TaxID=7740 RepID=UPI003454CB6F